MMKFTLAVFCMLLAGAAANGRDTPFVRTNFAGLPDKYQPDMVSDLGKTTMVDVNIFENDFTHTQSDLERAAFNKFKWGCREIQKGETYIIKYIRELTKSKAKRQEYNVDLWANGHGLDDLLNSGCAWCATQGQTKCHAWRKEFNYYLRFKLGQWRGEHGRITKNEPFCKYPCSGGNACEDTPEAIKQKWTCKGEFVNGKFVEHEGTQYGDHMLTVNGWAVPKQWQGRGWGTEDDQGREEFVNLDNAMQCYTRGTFTCAAGTICYNQCASSGYVKVDDDNRDWPDPENKVEQGMWDVTVGVRKTIDAKGPSPVNQSKGFDGYQTALIVGCCVATAFITAGIMFACRGGEKEIETPVVEVEQVVVA